MYGILTNYFKGNCKDHEQKHEDKKSKESPVVIGANTVGYPGTMMVIDRNTRITDLAMPRSFWFYNL